MQPNIVQTNPDGSVVVADTNTYTADQINAKVNAYQNRIVVLNNQISSSNDQIVKCNTELNSINNDLPYWLALQSKSQEAIVPADPNNP